MFVSILFLFFCTGLNRRLDITPFQGYKKYIINNTGLHPVLLYIALSGLKNAKPAKFYTLRFQKL
jgi:hypothetical protein